MSLVKLPSDFIQNEKYNFWDVNNQLIIMSPFSELYNNDKSKDKKKSSKIMSTVFLLSEPDPEKNIFYRIPYNERLKMLKETYCDFFDETDDVVKKCLSKYPSLCLSAIERALKEEIDLMVNRAEFLIKESKNLTLDRTEIIDGKPITIKGNAVQIDAMKSKTVKMYEDYDRLQKKFLKQKQESRLYGGRKKSKSEKKLL